MNNTIKRTLIPLAIAAAMLAEGCTINVTYTNNKDKSRTEIDNSQNKNQHNRTDNSQYIKDKSHTETDSHDKSIWYEKIISSFRAKFKKNHVTPLSTNNGKGKTGGLEKKVTETPQKHKNTHKTLDQSKPYNNQSTPYNNEQVPENQGQPAEPVESDLQIKTYKMPVMPVRTEILGGYTNNPSFRTTTRPDDFDRMDYILSFPQ